MPTTLNRRERKAAQLLAHYQTCERIGTALGMKDPDGKRISVALFKLERVANAGATAYCNGEEFRHDYGIGNAHTSGSVALFFHFGKEENAWDKFEEYITTRFNRIFGKSHKWKAPGFFVNGDARGYSLKVDPDDAQGKVLIDGCRMHTDWGGYGILSPEITGD